MSEIYARDLDLNLLRVFAVVAHSRSVTRAAAQLYLTQPAVSAALARLTRSVGAPLFARAGRGLTLTARGERLYEQVAPLLGALVAATLSPARFDPKSSERVLRIGVSDALEGIVLSPLMRLLEREAPRMRLIVLPVQFRTVGELLAARQADMALTVADELPASVRREPLFHGDFVCLYDARSLRLPRKLTEPTYFAQKHAIVSYNGDLRGVVEDSLHKQRDIRCSVASFGQLGPVLDGSALLATVPRTVARHLQSLYPNLETARVPLSLSGTPVELLWPQSIEDDEAFSFVRDHVRRIARRTLSGSRAPARRP